MTKCLVFRRGGAGASDFPEYTYSGSHVLLDDGIVDGVQNWRIKLLTSGDLVVTSGTNTLDIFIVGGGAGGGWGRYGGGGGYTNTQTSIVAEIGHTYAIVVGSGGNINSKGGTSSAFTYSALGGYGNGTSNNGGGSGGGAGSGWNNSGGSGGSNGSNGSTVLTNVGGTGQGTTTREFGEATGDLYAGGGGGGNGISGMPYGTGGAGGGGRGGNPETTAVAGTANTGGGGGGRESNTGAAGGSGIVVIRNHR